MKTRFSAAHALLALLLAGCTQLPPSPPVLPASAPDVPMVVDRFDEAQLSRAIFDETNRVRALHGQGILRPDPGLDAAAAEQASYTGLVLRAGHANPVPGEHDVADRVAHQGVEVSRLGENVIMMAAVRPEGSASPYYGYREFAALLLDAWMNSPGHRANILSGRFNYLGCATRLSHAVQKNDYRIFAVQVFARPQVQGMEGARSP